MSILQTAAHYLQWGWVQISIANLIVIGAMLIVFACAVFIRMPSGHGAHRSEEAPDDRR